MSKTSSAVGSMSLAQLVLVVARDADYRAVLVGALEQAGYQVLAAAEREEAITKLAARRPDAIVSDVQATGTFAPLPAHEDVPVVIIASKPSESALRNLRARAADVLLKPVRLDLLVDVVGTAVANTKRTGTFLRPPAASMRSTHRSAAMRALLAEVERLRDSDCSVLVLGETGTGKTVLARRIHSIGARSAGPFVDLNCAGLTTELMESELFGHERGSFTGAHAAKQGLFDVAHDGTLFLDEIGDIDMRVQPRILKVLEEKRFRRMGDVRERSVDVRLVAATHQDLLASVAQRRFRADLYYRISTIRLVVPSLRDRTEDIVPLAEEMLERVGESGVELSRDAEQRLVEYHWPGNIRELKNVIESSTLLRRGTKLTADDLRFDPPSERALPVFTSDVASHVSQLGVTLGGPSSGATGSLSHNTPVSGFAVPPPSERALPVDGPSSRLLAAEATEATRADVEREHIRLALLTENGRVEAAARRLGIPRSTLYWKLKRYGIKPNGEVA